jgi:hypothetical protein
MPLSQPQSVVANDLHRFRVICAGRRWGKTFLSVNQLARFAAKPNQKVMYVAPTYRMAKGIVWDHLKSRLIDLRWAKKINESDLTITLVNGSKILVRGADNFDSLRGLSNNFIVLDEAAMIDPRAWSEVLRPTLSDTGGHALFISTPTGQANWFFDLYNKHTDDSDHWSSHHYTSIQGGNIPEWEIEQARRDLDARTFQQEYEASFINHGNQIAYAFSRSDNLVSLSDVNTDIIHIGCDFNINPVSAAVYVRQGDDLFQIDEIAMFNSNTFELADEINTRYPNSKIFVYPDPAGSARKTSSGGQTDHTILANAGMIVKAPRRHNAVKDRINSYNARLCSSDGVRHLFIDPKCRHTIESLEKFSYKEGTQTPDKGKFDHMFDAASYCVDFLFPLVKERIEDPYAASTWGHALA